jgi:hypothetical protein
VGFKSDREFLRNVSIGAIGTRKIAAILRTGGFSIIELERYSSSNMIWTTKIKRLRVPDLLCLKSGARVECRAKGDLKITMSHAVNNPDRAWDKGLRDNDLVAFIRCWPAGDSWVPSDRVALFRVRDMRATQGLAKLERMKSASEGSEVQITWPATVPNSGGRVVEVSGDRITTLLAHGRRQTYRLERQSQSGFCLLTPHVAAGDTFGEGDTITASCIPNLAEPTLPQCPQYDFCADLDSDSPETVYAGVKALGFLPDLGRKSKTRLEKVMESCEDLRIGLEAAVSLARLGFEQGWDRIARIVAAHNTPRELRMECALILAELPDTRSIDLLKATMTDTGNESELRAAGAWGVAMVSADIRQSGLLQHVHDSDELTAVHAIAGASRLISPQTLDSFLEAIGRNDRQSAGIVRSLLASPCDFVSEVVRSIRTSSGKRRQWLLYLLGCRGRDACAEFLRSEAPELLQELDFFWTHHVENWTNRLDVADQISFLREQMLE